MGVGTNTLDSGSDSAALSRQQLYDNFKELGFGPYTTGVTTTGEVSKLVKTDSLGDIYERGFRVAEDFKTTNKETSLYYNGTYAYSYAVDNINLNFTDDFSWKFVLNSDHTVLGYLVDKVDPSGTGRGYRITMGATGAIKLRVIKTITSDEASIYTQSGFNDGKDHVVVIVKSTNTRANWKIYVDGVSQLLSYYGNDSITDGDITNTTNLFVCRNSAGAQDFKNCTFKEIVGFNCALTQAEVQKISYSNVPYYLFNANNTILTSGTIIVGKKYKVIDAGTGIQVNGVTQAVGSEVVATSKSVTWNGGSLRQLGSIVNYSYNSLTSAIWHDINGNNLDLTNTQTQIMEVDNKLVGEAGKKYKVVAGVLRNDGSGWTYISDSAHGKCNISSISVVGGRIRVTYSFTATKIISFVACPDEDFASKGYFIGSSVGNVYSDITICRGVESTIGGYITYNGSSWVVNSAGTGNLAVDNFTAGALNLTHADIGVGTSYLSSATASGGTYRAALGSLGDVTSQIEFYDNSGVLATTANTNMKVFFTRSRSFSTETLDAQNVISSIGNIWIYGIFEV